MKEDKELQNINNIDLNEDLCTTVDKLIKTYEAYAPSNITEENCEIEFNENSFVYDFKTINELMNINTTENKCNYPLEPLEIDVLLSKMIEKENLVNEFKIDIVAKNDINPSENINLQKKNYESVSKINFPHITLQRKKNKEPRQNKKLISPLISSSYNLRSQIKKKNRFSKY